MVANSRARISNFVSSVSEDVVKKCIMIILIKKMYLSRLMFHAPHILEEKLKENK